MRPGTLCWPSTGRRPRTGSKNKALMEGMDGVTDRPRVYVFPLPPTVSPLLETTGEGGKVSPSEGEEVLLRYGLYARSIP